MSQDNVMCGKCDRKMELCPCHWCEGTGEMKPSFMSSKCLFCGGAGKIRKCSNGHAQQLEEPLLTNVMASKGRPVPTKPVIAISPLKQKCPVCRGTKAVRHPFTGQIGPCPKCKGQGLI